MCKKQAQRMAMMQQPNLREIEEIRRRVDALDAEIAACTDRVQAHKLLWQWDRKRQG